VQLHLILSKNVPLVVNRLGSLLTFELESRSDSRVRVRVRSRVRVRFRSSVRGVSSPNCSNTLLEILSRPVSDPPNASDAETCSARPGTS